MINQARFESILHEHRLIVLKVVNAFTRHTEDQQDLIQEIRLQLWRAYPTYDSSRTFSTWMYQVALNTAISWSRSTQRSKRVSSLEQTLHEPTVVTEIDPDLYHLYDLINQLEPFNRALLLLYLDDLTHQEISDVLGISVSNVATKISRLKLRLRQLVTNSETPKGHINGTR